MPKEQQWLHLRTSSSFANLDSLQVPANWNLNAWFKFTLNSLSSSNQFAMQATGLSKHYLLSLKSPPSFLSLTRINFITYSIQYNHTSKLAFNRLGSNFNKTYFMPIKHGTTTHCEFSQIFNTI